MTLQIRSNTALDLWPRDQIHAGQYSQQIAATRKQALQPHISEVIRSKYAKHSQNKATSLEEKLYDVRALCKIRTASVAMYLTSEWRSRFFSQLDNLLDAENWEEEDTPIIEASFNTFLRMIMLMWPVRRPGLGATSEGNIIAAWTVDRDRLTIECLPGDKVRWVVSWHVEGMQERAAGDVSLTRLLAVLSPYDPKRWFIDAA
ncbi:hypothetical protein [Methylomonas rosea]|uniref:Uncharacterized protein n=1 Tax=Methylomonas rosea TaxID=2952227 RepID=A0ABT1TW36_9GAMM|nr:hypothetical protein [Methylomonas sp. WSC-7]MCQ8118985.1 hypothetical protein [Methylomonas sp. WSC-7]